MWKRRFVVVAALLVAGVVGGGVAGCDSEHYDRDAKREMDRVAIDLSRARKENDQYQAQLARAQADLAQAKKANDSLTKQLADTEDRLRQTQDNLAAAQRQVQPPANKAP